MSVMSNNDSSHKREGTQIPQITALSIIYYNLDQLNTLYGKSRASDIAHSLVYGDKPKQKENRPVRQSTEPAAFKTFVSNSSMAQLPPSKLTLLSQQLYNHVNNTLEEQKSQRAFYHKDQNILLSPQRLHSLPTQQVQTDVVNRLIDCGTFINDKKTKIKEQVDNDLLAECSFQPQIDSRSRNLAIRQTNTEIRTADEFHEDQMRYLQNIQSKKEQLQKLQQESQELTNPKLSQKTLQLASKYSVQPLVERLHQQQKSTTVSQEESYSFRPEISKKSRLIKRENTVQDDLYHDAKARLELKQTTETMVQESLIQPQDKSLQWFVQRFIKEFYYHLSGLPRIQDSKDYSKINETETQILLKGLGFGESKEVWSVLNQGFYILSRNLLVAMLAILAVPPQHIEIPCYKPKVEENIQVKSNYKTDEYGNLILNEVDCQNLHKKFYSLYLNTKQQNGNGIRRQQARSPSEVRISSPSISIKSKELAYQKKANTNLYDWFTSQELKRKQNLEKLKLDVETQEMKEIKTITRPITINLSDLAKPIQKQENKTSVDVEFEREQHNCTFKPSINKSMRPSSVNERIQQQIEKQAVRIQEARIRQKTILTLKEKGTTTNNVIRQKQKEATEQQLQNELKQVKTKSKPIHEVVPLLFVDVNIEDGQTARIVVYEGDNSLDLAIKFSQEHNLDDSMRDKLKELLDMQINSLLTKIDEVYDDEQ